MEENSEAHMDTDVSSTTDDAIEVQEADNTHRNVETVITVEKIKEEDMSPSKQKNNDKAVPAVLPAHNESLKPVEKPPQRELPLKKIIIKSCNKDYQIVKIVQKTSTTEEPQKSGKNIQHEKPEFSGLQTFELDSSNSESNKSPNKFVDKTVHNSPSILTCQNEAPKIIQKSPIKDLQPQESKSGKEFLAKPLPVKELTVKAVPIQEMTIKSAPVKDIISISRTVSTKETAKVSPIKETVKTSFTQDAEKLSSIKETANISPVKETPKVSPVKETVKISPVKETTKVSPTKETLKVSPAKDALAKVNSAKEISSTVKEITSTKELPPKIAAEKDQPGNTMLKQLSVPEKPNFEITDCKSEDQLTKSNTTAMDVDKEASNDSQMETNSDTSEKEHNKSISRELRSLINSAKESKIISECTQLTSKTRKSRALDSSNTSLNVSGEADKIQGIRRGSDNSQKSGCSEKSERGLKRSMRSQNPEFVHKVKMFLNSVTGKVQKEGETSDEEPDNKPKDNQSEPMTSSAKSSVPKKKKSEETPEKSNRLQADSYCWRCHWAVELAANEKSHPPMLCTVCPRAFHYKCLTGTERSKICMDKSWVCPECLLILHAESSETRSPAMKKISLGMLCDLLKHALQRMMDINGVEPFLHPVDRTTFPDYDKYVVHPMDLTLMKDNISMGLYGSTEAFLADAQWILHNSIIFNTLQSKLTAGARALVRSCRAEMGEIEACPECYAGAHARRSTWFTDVCTTPHMLLWAKLKGFPYWPAKGMSVSSAGLVDVRFFGAHDRAWVPARDCFLYSEKDPNNFRTKRQDILDSMQEAEQHIRNISRKYGKFVYPPFKTQFDPSKLNEQLKMMIPSFEGEVRSPVKEKPANTSPGMVKGKSRSTSKSSKGSVIDGDMSEGDESLTTPRKMADGAEIAREDESFLIEREKDKVMEVEVPQSRESDAPRKRRRSCLEEAVITILDINKEKRRRVESSDKPNGEKPSGDKPDKPIVEKTNSDKATVLKPSGDNTITDKTTGDKSSDDKPAVDKPGTYKPSIDKLTIEKPDGNKPNVNKAGNDKLLEEKIEQKVIGNKVTTEVQKPKELEKPKGPETPKTKDSEPSSSTAASGDKLTPPKRPGIRLISIAKVLKNAKVNKVNPKENTDKQHQKQKPKIDKSNSSEKVNTPEEKTKAVKRRNSKSNKSLNNSNAGKTDKKNEKSADSYTGKEKSKDNNTVNKSFNDKFTTDKNTPEKTAGSKTIDSPRSTKERLQFDDDTSLAVIAREASKNVTIGLPTITSVRSLSTTSLNTSATSNKTPTNSKSIEVTVEATSDSSIFTPTSTDNVRNMKEAVNKLQRLRNETDTPVGRVGVRAFARMTSPEQEKRPNNDVEVEIKAEPMDFDDADRQMEKMDLMNAFKLRPVNPPTSSLREVRINKVVVTPVNTRKVAPKPVELRPRAKKTFPQPKKADDGRSELNSKNSMVYIPIQPPMTQAPVRIQRPTTAANGPTTTVPAPRPIAPVITSTSNVMNSVTTSMLPTTLSSPTPTSAPSSSIITSPVQAVPTVGQVPTIGQVPTTVHTVPLITSVNGQWTFSLQPVMSVGGVDGAPSPPMLNGISEINSAPPLLPISSGAAPGPITTPTLLPALPPVLVPTTTTPTPTRTPSDTSLPGELPRLQQRPSLMNPLDASTPVGSVPPPSTAGPLTAKLNQNAVKMTDFFRTLLEDSLEKLDEPSTQVTALKLQLEQINWRHQQQIDEIKHNHELTLAEIRSSFEKEKIRLVSEARRLAQVELEVAVKQAKSKQWCANCNQEAQFYCCWNTSYCDYPCQRAHWAQHYAVCTQQRQDSGDNPPENRLQPPPENLPKTTAAPNLTAGGKLAPSRVYTQEQHGSPKTSIIMSMVEDTSGNQTMKCVGTYKQATPAQMTPLIINKQLMNNEEAAKKVVTSGGYLIVGAANTAGASNTTGAIVTQARRTHTIQYYT